MFPYIFKALKVKTTAKTNEHFANGFIDIGQIADELNVLKIGNISLKIKPEQLATISYPAIAHCEQAGKMPYFVVLTSFQNEVINYYQAGIGEQKEGIATFAQKWSGVVMLLAPDGFSGEPNYAVNKKQEAQQKLAQWLAWGAAALGVLLGVWFMPNASQQSLWFLACIGAAASAMLLGNETGQLPAFAQKLCNFAPFSSTKTVGQSGCNAIAQSKDAKIFGWLSWSEIGLVYFLGILLYCCLGLKDSFSFMLLAACFVPYSLYYQAFVIKKWCTLCLIVQAVLVAMATLVWFSFGLQQPSTQACLSLLMVYSWIIAIWFCIRKAWLEHPKLAQIEASEANWHRNSSVFMAYLAAQPLVNLEPLPHEDQVGNSNAPVIITMVSNPACNPCQTAYEELTALQRYFEDEMQLRIRHINSPDANHQSHQDWATAIGIEYTPTIFINGRQLKEPYTVKDIQYHIRALAEPKTL